MATYPDIVNMLNREMDFDNDMDKVDEYLYLGDLEAAEDADPNTIKVVITILDFEFRDCYKKNGIEYHSVILEDDDTSDLLSHLPQTNRWITDAIESKRTVLVHCRAGISRSATVVCAYIMKKYNMTSDGAINWVREKRDIYPNDGFLKQLKVYHQMGFTLNANYRVYRYFLFNSYLLDETPLKTYFERLSIAEAMTEDLDLGREYCCVRCSTPAFHEINIVCNSGAEEEQCQRFSCPDMYIEPKKWMTEQIEGLPNKQCQGQIQCLNCSKVLALFKHYNHSNKCVTHKLLNNCLKIKVIAGSVEVPEAKVKESQIIESKSDVRNLV